MKTAFFSAVFLLLAKLSAFAIVDLGTTTSQTPYDRYMEPVKQTFDHLHGEGTTMSKVQALMRQGREFRYVHTEPYVPAAPEETAARHKGDCKDKALWLIDQLQDPSARFVIGKEKRGAAVSHAWVMWQNEGRWWILDCTMTSKPMLADQVSMDKYVPLYSWTKGVSFRHTDKAFGAVAKVATRKQTPAASKGASKTDGRVAAN